MAKLNTKIINLENVLLTEQITWIKSDEFGSKKSMLSFIMFLRQRGQFYKDCNGLLLVQGKFTKQILLVVSLLHYWTISNLSFWI